MELFIQIKNGQPFEHPIFGDNFRAAFPHIDVNNLPPEFARFKRVIRPSIGPYEVWIEEDPTYELVDGFYTDVWHKRDMTTEEKTAKQQAVKDEWASRGLSSWVFNEETCKFEAPFPKPDDGNIYKWDEATISWVPFEEVVQESAPVVQVETSTIVETVTPVVEQTVVTSDNGADSIVGGAGL